MTDEPVRAPDDLRRKALLFDVTYEEGLAEAVGRAEEALRRLAPTYERWMDEGVEQLHAAYLAHRAAPGTRTAEALFAAAHDLRGQAGALDAPVIGRIAGGLARLLAAGGADPAFVSHSVEAIRAVRRERADRDDPIGLAIAAEIEERVEAALAARPLGSKPR
ncbi:MAG TPA: hypothetical protein VIL65_17375 [Beijerinckiaceae bacterium]